MVESSTRVGEVPGAQAGATVCERLAGPGPAVSFEFFPPKTDAGEEHLWQAVRELEPLHPTFVSVTYGAGGSTRDRTVRLTSRIAAETTLLPMAHLTCVGHSRTELREIVGQYAAEGVRNILALRGDPPGGPRQPWEQHADGFRYALELVEMIKGLGDFCVGVAAFPDVHPAAPDGDTDARHLAAKVAAGADFAVTQFFFDADQYFRLVDRAAAYGCTVPVVPGIMPVTNVRQVERFAELSGTPFPADLAARLTAVSDDPEAVRAIGVDTAATLAQRLLDGGAPGLHFYTLNRSTATREVWSRLALQPPAGAVEPVS